MMGCSATQSRYHTFCEVDDNSKHTHTDSLASCYNWAMSFSILAPAIISSHIFPSVEVRCVQCTAWCGLQWRMHCVCPLVHERSAINCQAIGPPIAIETSYRMQVYHHDGLLCSCNDVAMRLIPYDSNAHPAHEMHETFPSVTFYFMKKVTFWY